MPLNYSPKFATAPALQEYFVSLGSDFLSMLEAEAAGLAAILKPVGEAFVANLRSVEAVACLPFAMASTARTAMRFDRIYLAERIKAEPIDDPPEKLDALALERARQKFDAEMATNDAREAQAQLTLQDLSRSLNNETMLSAAHELLRTSTVLLWGALEVLINDLGELLLNQKPYLCDLLSTNEYFKKRINLKSISFDDLKRFSFDLSGHIGTVLFENSKLDNVGIMREFFDALDKQNSQLRESLRSPILWRMGQRRNLIVHRRGIVDRPYIEATGEDVKIGERLRVAPSDLQDYFDACRDIGIHVIRTVSSKLSG